MRNPKISIITVCYNAEKTIERCIKSVMSCEYDNIEYVVIDGNSTDGTKSLLSKYSSNIDFLLSEPDKGIYDAMNKGVNFSSGEWIMFLNSDDFINPGVLNSYLKVINENPGAELICGSVRKIREGAHFHSVINRSMQLHDISSKFYHEMVFPHVSMLYRKSLFELVGLFNASFNVSGDQEHLIRIFLGNHKIIRTDFVLANVLMGGVSNGLDANREYKRAAIIHGQSRIKANFIYFTQAVKYMMRLVLGDAVSVVIGKLLGSRHCA